MRRWLASQLRRLPVRAELRITPRPGEFSASSWGSASRRSSPPPRFLEESAAADTASGARARMNVVCIFAKVFERARRKPLVLPDAVFERRRPAEAHVAWVCYSRWKIGRSRSFVLLRLSAGTP
jgi:hypothetical protein